MADGEDRGGENVVFLAIQTNSEGRPCCWAQRATAEAARKRAAELWDGHGGSGCGCYPGEERGEIVVHAVPA